MMGPEKKEEKEAKMKDSTEEDITSAKNTADVG